MIYHGDCGGIERPPRCRNTGAAAGHLDRRLDNADAAKVFTLLLALLLFKVLDAFEATPLLVRTEFLDKWFTSFLGQVSKPQSSFPIPIRKYSKSSRRSQ